MSSPFVAEVRMFGFNYAPKSWALCNGQIMPIAQNTALYSLLGTNYGGNGTSTFGLPNLQGSFPITSGQGAGLSPYQPGQAGGAASVTLNLTQIPSHNHSVNGQAATGDSATPGGKFFAQLPTRTQFSYGPDNATAGMASNAVQNAGGGQPHNNLPLCLVVNYCIALTGIFPPRP